MDEYSKILNVIKQTPSFSKSKSQNNGPWLYQYRSLSAALAILKSDCFWATNARFSNDEEEQRFIAKILETPLKKQGIHIASEALGENYIICFSAGCDMLSQWRGYAPDGGVSIGFDFLGAAPFCIETASESISMKNNNKNTCVYAQAEQVVYLQARNPAQSEAEYYHSCYDAIHFNPGTQKPVPEDMKQFEEELIRKAPYIKHKGFFEEDEWRLVFSNAQNQLNGCIRYRHQPESIIEIPYILVRAGLTGREQNPCVVRVCIQDNNRASHLIQEFRESLQGCVVENCLPKQEEGDLTDNFCFGCRRRRWVDNHTIFDHCRWNHSGKNLATFDVGIPSCENSVIISQGQHQEEVFEKVYAKIQEISNNANTVMPHIKVWCEGHLPVRSITIGPSRNQQNIFEYVQHFCRHIYWLRDVEINTSSIPFRKSME